jgi:hypothetical protein
MPMCPVVLQCTGPIRPYDMVASFMSLLLHERGIHIV